MEAYTTQLVQETANFVKAELEGTDASHDWLHIARVYNIATSLAKEEGIKDIELVQLGALLHDIGDWKYTGSETAGVEKSSAFLKSKGVDESRIDLVGKIIDGVSFKNELKRKVELFPELAVVQDADRLDAIGAVGIARTFTFGGAKSRTLYNPDGFPSEVVSDLSKEQYMSANGDTIQHFYDKLLKLKDMLKTESGRKRANRRHDFMVQFLDEFFREVRGEY